MSIKNYLFFTALSILPCMIQSAQPYRNSKELMQDISQMISGELERAQKSIEQLRANAKNAAYQQETSQYIESVTKNLEKIMSRYTAATLQEKKFFWSQRIESLKPFNSFMDWYEAKAAELAGLRKTVADLTGVSVYQAPSGKTFVTSGKSGVPIARIKKQETRIQGGTPIIIQQHGLRVAPQP